MQKKTLGLLALITATFMGSAIFPTLIRFGILTIHPFSFNFFRYLITTFLFIPTIHQLLKTTNIKIIIKDLPLFGMLGVNSLLFSIGIQHTTIVVSQLIYTLTPAVVAILSIFILKKYPSKQKIIGIIIAVSGVLLLMKSSITPGLSQSLGTINGNLTITVGMIFYSLYLIFSKKLSTKYNPFTIAAMTSIALTILFIPFTTYDFSFGNGLQNISQQSFLSLVALSIFTAIFTLLVQYGIKNLNATTAAMGVLFAPIFAFISGIFMFNEKISFTLITSLLLVLIGMITSINDKINKTS